MGASGVGKNSIFMSQMSDDSLTGREPLPEAPHGYDAEVSPLRFYRATSDFSFLVSEGWLHQDRAAGNLPIPLCFSGNYYKVCYYAVKMPRHATTSCGVRSAPVE